LFPAQNVLVSELPGQEECYRVKLADFDSAKKLEAEFTQSGLKPMGTHGFVAPEV
jgi:serine/threonine protein kinase